MTQPFAKPNYTWEELTITLDQAKPLREIDVAGDFVRVDEASDPTAHVFVRLNDPVGGPRRKLRLSAEIDGADFNKLYLDWPEQRDISGNPKWVKLLVATTYGTVRMGSPDPVEFDITGLVKIAPHVITSGGRRADHRYTVSITPNVKDRTAVSYTEGEELFAKTVEGSGGGLQGVAWELGLATHGDRKFWATSQSGGVSVDSFKEDGKLIESVTISGWPRGIVWDRSRSLFAVTDNTFNGGTEAIRYFDPVLKQEVAGLRAELAYSPRVLAYDHWNDRIFVGDSDGVVHILDADTFEEDKSWAAPDAPDLVAISFWDEDSLFLMSSGLDGQQYFVSPETGSIQKTFSGGMSATQDGTVDRQEDVFYGVTGSTFKKIALADVDIKGRGFATTGTCGGFELLKDQLARITADVDLVEERYGRTRARGEVVRLALELYFQAQMPADYLDHVYLARFERTGMVFGGNAETWASQGVEDLFDVLLPQTIEITIDNDLQPIF